MARTEGTCPAATSSANASAARVAADNRHKRHRVPPGTSVTPAGAWTKRMIYHEQLAGAEQGRTQHRLRHALGRRRRLAASVTATPNREAAAQAPERVVPPRGVKHHYRAGVDQAVQRERDQTPCPDGLAVRPHASVGMFIRCDDGDRRNAEHCAAVVHRMIGRRPSPDTADCKSTGQSDINSMLKE